MHERANQHFLFPLSPISLVSFPRAFLFGFPRIRRVSHNEMQTQRVAKGERVAETRSPSTFASRLVSCRRPPSSHLVPGPPPLLSRCYLAMRPFQIRGGGRGGEPQKRCFSRSLPLFFRRCIKKRLPPVWMSPLQKGPQGPSSCCSCAVRRSGPSSPRRASRLPADYKFHRRKLLSSPSGPLKAPWGGGEAQAEGALSRRRGPGEEGGRKQKHAVLADKLLDSPGHPLLNASLASNECRRHCHKDAGP